MDRFIRLQDYLLSIYNECDQIFSLLGMVLGTRTGWNEDTPVWEATRMPLGSGVLIPSRLGCPHSLLLKGVLIPSSILIPSHSGISILRPHPLPLMVVLFLGGNMDTPRE